MTHISQVIVIVTIVGVDRKGQVFYTYTDPAFSSLHVEDVISDVGAVTPYHTLYALDYASSRNGWEFKEHIIEISGGSTEHHLADNRLSMITHHNSGKDHKFKFEFYNRWSKESTIGDPQEGNVKEPTGG
jgi:hypothetical protein